MGALSEWVDKKFVADAVDKIKTVALFAYELTAIADIVTLLEAVVSMAKGNPEEVDGFEVTFATIGVAVTSLAIVTGVGTAALPGVRAGLKSLRPALRELFETGAKDALKVGILAGKFMLREIKAFIKNPGKPRQDLADFIVALQTVAQDATGKALNLLFNTVRSIDGLIVWARGYRLNKKTCLTQSEPPIPHYYALVGEDGSLHIEDRVAQAIHDILRGVVSQAFAANCTGVLHTEKIDDIRQNTARYGGQAKFVARRVAKAVTELDAAGISIAKAKSYEVLGDVINKGDPAFIEKFVENAKTGFRNSGGKRTLDLRGRDGMMDELMDKLALVPTDNEKYREFMKPLSYNNGFRVRGMYTEARAIDEIATSLNLDKSTLKLDDRVNESYVNGEGKLVTPGKGGHEATDGELTLPGGNGAKLWIEAKNWAKQINAVENARRWEELDKQFRKHVNTRIRDNFRNRGSFRFRTNPPILHYRLEGSFFKDISPEEVAERFNAILEKKYPDLVKNGFKIRAQDIVVDATPNHPLVN